MGFFNMFKRPKKHVEPEKNDLPDEEYKIPVLKRAEFEMTEELLRRKENEELLKRYGIILTNAGEFI